MKDLHYIIKYSYRNLFRNFKRTLIMIGSLAFATGYIIWVLNFADSSSKEITKEFLSQNTGRYIVSNPDFYEVKNKKNFNIYKTMELGNEISSEELTKSTPRVLTPVFVSGESKTIGVLLHGIDVKKELKLSTLKEVVKEGRFLKADETNSILLGIKFAQKIQATVGSKVALLGQSIDGAMAGEHFTVVGLMDFGGGDLEESVAYTQLSSAQNFLSMSENQFHQLVSFDMSDTPPPVYKNYATTSWELLLPEISVSMRFIDNFTWLVCIVIVLVISLGLTNTLLITFLERETEFNSLNIIGAQMKWISLSLVIEVIIMGTVAIILGVGIGYGLTILCHYYPINLEWYTGGKPIILGGMTLKPLVKIYIVHKYFWQVPLLIYLFLAAAMIYPLAKVIRRSQHAL